MTAGAESPGDAGGYLLRQFDTAWKLAREDVAWPGSAESVREELGRLQDRWRPRIAGLPDEALRSATHVRWPFSEIGYARFHDAVRPVPGTP